MSAFPILEKRDEVIMNIARAAEEGRFNDKVEVDDPTPSAEELRTIREGFVASQGTIGYKRRRNAARVIANIATTLATQDSTVEGIENAREVRGGAVITSNHFSPVDNTMVRKMVRKLGQPYLPIVCNDTNFAMTGLFGFLMNYADTIPISADPRYLMGDFSRIIADRLARGQKVLIYPEQEMWFNYRKPRPGKRGAYLFAARNNVPVISCFVEIHDKDKLQASNFVEVSYTIHVLKPIYPDPSLSVHQNSVAMMERDYQQRVDAYERSYHKKLDYAFTPGDIAGWVPPAEVSQAFEWRVNPNLNALPNLPDLPDLSGLSGAAVLEAVLGTHANAA